jgi:PAS domain-containing protein
MNASFQGLAEIDADGYFEAVNLRFAALLDKQPEDIIRQHLDDVIHKGI